ncbi:LLM class flavin-dependent oxidoreductase [Deinococcus sp. Marseille-Q6407]|uniref:LLM class flavin-dependent oxidoreductase n=1 Tax=Deinococcus sp. Marseille-Q6407 TaxID=2969223 RepID=UPI0021C001E4|nr:LLM class flavin-dependent oxidoreductase [Deinococcus sp. Marseille-Q6407]
MTDLKLSVLDLFPVSEGMTPGEALEQSLQLAELADASGYTRYWVAEHHNTETFISSATEILIGQAAQRTRRMRVGSGGIMLPNHSPLKVAENFLTLNALFPGRIDLGLGRAPGTDGRTALALRRAPDALATDDFGAQIAMLQAFGGEAEWPGTSLFSTVQAHPQGQLPPLYILGSSLYGAELAGKLGRPYAFAYHFSGFDPCEALDTYRRHFRPSPYLAEPYAILGVNAVAAPTQAEAQELSLSSAALALGIASGRRGPLMNPADARQWLEQMEVTPQQMLKKAAIGSGEETWAQLQALAERTGAQELLVTTHVFDPVARRRSYELLAQAAVNCRP